jgi:putative ABC transport system substrate-binding protein
MKRRDLIGLLGLTVAAPLTARARRAPTAVIGYLSSRSPDNSADIIAAFRRGLNDAGFVDGQNVMIESRFADVIE